MRALRAGQRALRRPAPSAAIRPDFPVLERDACRPARWGREPTNGPWPGCPPTWRATLQRLDASADGQERKTDQERVRSAVDLKVMVSPAIHRRSPSPAGRRCPSGPSATGASGWSTRRSRPPADRHRPHRHDQLARRERAADDADARARRAARHRRAARRARPGARLRRLRQRGDLRRPRFGQRAPRRHAGRGIRPPRAG
jgi:hypothetical protein